MCGVDTLSPSVLDVDVPDELEAMWIDVEHCGTNVDQVDAITLCAVYNRLVTTVEAMRVGYPMQY